MASDNLPAKPSSKGDIDAFLGRAAKLPSLAQTKGRLIFAIDATMSRQPTWTKATEIQSDMFAVAQAIGGLAVQLVYFRAANSAPATGPRRRSCSRTACATSPAAAASPSSAACSPMPRPKRARPRSVRWSMSATPSRKTPDAAAAEAGRLALLGVPAFMFHEGDDPHAGAVFRDIARLTKGVYARFDAGAAKQLRELLMAAAIYATGGAVALREHARKQGGAYLRIADQMDRK
ncbi:MAG: hypothetical protein WDM81_18125 [Rhizomicrobium sp.]